MSAEQSLQHIWLSQDVTYMRAKRLSIARHKRYMARLNWQVRLMLKPNIQRKLRGRRSAAGRPAVCQPIADVRPTISTCKNDFVNTLTFLLLLT